MHRFGLMEDFTSSPRSRHSVYRELDEKLELLEQLSLEETDRWLQDEYTWTMEELNAPESHIPFACEEDDANACEVSVYDPSLFSPSSPTQSVFALPRQLEPCNRDKPLPSPPPKSILRPRRPPPVPPCSPSYTQSTFSSPPSSPRSPISSWTPPSSPRTPLTPRRSRTPSFNMSISSSRSAQTHSTLPSISSTLSLLEERDTEMEKRSGVLVMDAEQDNDDVRTGEGSREGTILAHPPLRKSSFEALKAATFSSSSEIIPPSFRRKTRPTLPALSTSTSSPQLRKLAALASIPASPVSAASPSSAILPSPQTITYQSQSLLRSHSFPVESFSNGSPICPSDPIATLPMTSMTLASRWSMDSTGPEENRPNLSNSRSDTPLGDSPSSPQKTRKRDRLISFISRGRAGSVGKPSAFVPATIPAADSDVNPLDLTLTETEAESNISARRVSRSRFAADGSVSTISLPLSPSRSATYPPPPMQMCASDSSPSTASSVSTLGTPIDVAHELPYDPFASAPLTQEPDVPELSSTPFIDEFGMPSSPPLPPTLPAPSPSTPTASFLFPTRQSSTFPFLSALTKRKTRRRKKLVISGAPFLLPDPPVDDDLDGRARAERERREQEQKMRYTNILKWCENFGAIRRIEKKDDGSLHVTWKNWESADLVCRVQAQVFIKDVGTVNLAWHYLN